MAKQKTKTRPRATKNVLSGVCFVFPTLALERDTSLREELVVSVSSTVHAIKGIWNTHCALLLQNPLSTRQPLRHTLQVGACEATCTTKDALVAWSHAILYSNLKLFYLSYKFDFFMFAVKSVSVETSQVRIQIQSTFID